MKIALKIICLTLLVVFVSNTNAGKYDNVQNSFLRSSDQSQDRNIANQGTENSSVTIDFNIKTGESWDAIDDSSNQIANCVMGNVITGIAWNNVKIETVDDSSWLSEANIKISDSTGNQGVELAIGPGDRFAGTGNYTSEGVLDFTDSGVSDIIALSDKKFPIQFFEEFDNTNDSIEAYFTSGTITLWGQNLSSNPNCAFSSIESSDLQVSVTADNTTSLEISEKVNFTITIENIGATIATNVIISDSLEGLHFVGATCNDGSTGTHENRIITTIVNDIPAGESLICSVQTQVVGFGEIHFSTSVLADNDSENSNNVAQLSFVGPAVVVPSNNWLTLLLLFLSIIFFARIFFKTTNYSG